MQRRSQALYAVLGDLPETLREAFILRDLEQIPAKDVADALEISPENVLMRTSRARRKIREALTRSGWLPKPRKEDE